MRSATTLRLRPSGPMRIRNRSVSRETRAAGAGLSLMAAGLYVALGGTPWLGLGLLLAPDLSAIGLLLNARLGVATYNTAHHPLATAIVLALALFVGWRAGSLCALVWLAHIGMDRAAGYGFKEAVSASGAGS